MPFIPRDPRQYRPGNPGQEWLNQLRSGGRLTASLPLLDATGSFTDRLKAPKAPGWRERQAAGQRARSASGTYAETQSRIPGAPTPGTRQASARPSATPSVASVISSLRPRGQGFMQEVAQGPPMTDRPPEQVYLNPITGRSEPMPSSADWLTHPVDRGELANVPRDELVVNPVDRGELANVPRDELLTLLASRGSDTTPVQDRTDVGDGGGGGFGGYVGAPGFSNALIGAGGAMMEAAGQPGATFGGSLGSGLKGFAAERARYQTSEAARRQTAQEGQTSPQDLEAKRSVIRARLALRGIDDPIDVQQYMAMVVDQDGYEAALEELEEPGAAEQTALEKEKERLAWYLSLSPEDQASHDLMLRGSPAGTTVNIEGDQAATPVGPAQAGMDTYVQGVYNRRATTFDSVMPSLQNVDQTLKLVNHARFGEVAGFLRGNPITDAYVRYEGDPELLAMIGTFERLGSDRALAILRNFTGAKSNFEFQVSEKMAAKNRSMSPEELRAMLELMRRAYIQEAVRWAQSMVYMGEDVQIEGDYAAVQRRFMSDAQGILDQYGAEERSWRQAVDPAGIGRGRGTN